MTDEMAISGGHERQIMWRVMPSSSGGARGDRCWRDTAARGAISPSGA